MLLSYGYKNVCGHSFTYTPYTALLRNEDIYSMSGFSAEKVGAILKISFTLNTAYGESAEVYTI